MLDWCGVKLTSPSAKEAERLLSVDADHAKVEPVSADMLRQQEENKCIMIRGLRKVYETTAEDRVAVKGLTMDIYEGQCTVLLGHNGAGI